MLTWSHDLQGYYLGTRAGNVHIVHVKEAKSAGVEGEGVEAGGGEGGEVETGGEEGGGVEAGGVESTGGEGDAPKGSDGGGSGGLSLVLDQGDLKSHR